MRRRKGCCCFRPCPSEQCPPDQAVHKTYREYQAHLDSILEELHKAVDNLQGGPVYDRICLLQSLQGVGFLSAVVLIAEMGSFDLFSSPKKLYAYFGMDPGVNDSGKFHGDRVHMSKRGSSLARRILHMIAINNLKVDKAAKAPVNPVIYDYYIRKCANKKKIVAVGAVMHKICNIISLCSGIISLLSLLRRKNTVNVMQQNTQDP